MHDLTLVRRSIPAPSTSRRDLGGVDLIPLVAVGAGVGLATLGPIAFALAIGGVAIGAVLRAVRRGRPGPFARPLVPTVMPHEIESPDLRIAYIGLLSAHESARHSLAAAPEANGTVGHLFMSACGLVEHGGKLAVGANALHRYLDLHPAEPIAFEIRELEERVAATTDREAATSYARALAARRRQLQARDAIATICDRVRARLELASASIGMLGAVAMELGGIELARATQHAEALAEQSEAMTDELGVLESVLAPGDSTAAAA